MSADAIFAAQAVSAPTLSVLQGIEPMQPTSPAGPTGAFGNIVSQGLDEVNQQLLTSQVDLQQLATGNVQNLHQVMIRLEESRLSFQLLMQVRNRLLESYQDILKMQV